MTRIELKKPKQIRGKVKEGFYWADVKTVKQGDNDIQIVQLFPQFPEQSPIVMLPKKFNKMLKSGGIKIVK